MKKKHHISALWNDNITQKLSELGINVKNNTPIQIDEEIYSELKPHLVGLRYITDVEYVEFNDAELDNSEYLLCDGFEEFGYPQPENNFGYLRETYDLSNYCDMCGRGLVQKAPFKIKKTPNLNKIKIFGLYWVYDAVFVSIDFYEKIFKPLNIGYLPVYGAKKREIENIIQLKIPEIDESLNLDFMDYELCPKCNHKKYTLIPKSFLPNYIEDVLPPIFLSNEYFGSGGQAFKGIFLNQKLRQDLIKEKQVNPKNFIPCSTRFENLIH
jgi:hypothetical protein